MKKIPWFVLEYEIPARLNSRARRGVCPSIEHGRKAGIWTFLLLSKPVSELLFTNALVRLACWTEARSPAQLEKCPDSRPLSNVRWSWPWNDSRCLRVLKIVCNNQCWLYSGMIIWATSHFHLQWNVVLTKTTDSHTSRITEFNQFKTIQKHLLI